MRGDTAVPLLGDLGHGVTLLSLIWVPWDTTVPFLGGRDVG